MKEEQPPPSIQALIHHRRRIGGAFTLNKFTKPTAYAILLFLSYCLGYLSAKLISISQLQSSPPLPIITNTITSPSSPTTTTYENSSTTAAITISNDHYLFTSRCAAQQVPPKLVRQTVLNQVFKGTSPYNNFPPAHISNLLRRKRIKGWGSYSAVFENLIRKVQPETIIEVGTFLGASAIHMATLTSGLGLDTQILCLDDFRGWPGFLERFSDMKMVNGDVLLLYQFMQNVVQVNATESILFVPFSTGSALEKLCEWGVYGDLIEIDAGHDFHSAWTDINRAYKLLRPGGVIFGHDYFNAADRRGVRRAVDLFARLRALPVQVDGQHWLIHSPPPP